MSENKRKRLTDEVQVAETQERVSTPKKEVKVENWLNSVGDFDWQAYEASCVSHVRKANPHVKTQNGDRVFSRESYAQKLYEVYIGSKEQVHSELEAGEIVDGKIFAITSDWISVDVNYRELVYVKTSKEPRYIIEDYRVGDQVSVLINTSIGNELGHVSGSISGGMKQRIFSELQNGIESADTAWVGNVTALIENGGYVVNIQGVDCFMPGSLAGINKLHDFNSIVGQDIYVVPVSFSIERGTIVVSHRKYLQALIPGAIQDLRSNIEQKQTGFVTGTAKFGIFCEFKDCLTGMIHTNDLDEETSAKFKSRQIKPGDQIEFWVKDIISDTKITLSQKVETIHNPWADIEKRFKVPCNVEAVVKTKKDYGLFITIEEGLVGLLHVSELADGIMDIYKPGDKITVQLNRIDKESQKIFLKLPK